MFQYINLEYICPFTLDLFFLDHSVVLFNKSHTYFVELLPMDFIFGAILNGISLNFNFQLFIASNREVINHLIFLHMLISYRNFNFQLLGLFYMNNDYIYE